MRFSDALTHLTVHRNRVQRRGWNGKGMWLQYIEGWTVDPNEKVSQSLLPFIGMKTADEKFVPWLASQTDVLANDWDVLIADRSALP